MGDSAGYMSTSIELTPAQIEFVNKYVNDFTSDTWHVECAGVAGSQRNFFRIRNASESYVMIVWDGRDEDWARFIGIQQELSSSCRYLPHIYAHDPLHGLILEEDLGVMTLKKYIQEKRTLEIENSYKKVLKALWNWQNIDKSESDTIQSRSMDYDTFLWESWYFGKFCVTDYFAGESLLTSDWEREREALAREASSLPSVFIHRDFQSENIMIHDDAIRFVDFQGARMGPREYDVASLLYDPYVEFQDVTMRQRLYAWYCSLSKCDYDRDRTFSINAAQRLMQALGAYGNLSLHKRKEWYRTFIPIALSRLQEVLDSLPEFSQLQKIISFCSFALKK
jgi:aminoglycoside/choline kinase family phosphotransferase